MRHPHHATRSVATVAGLYLATVAAGMAPLMGWAWMCETRKRHRRVARAIPR